MAKSIALVGMMGCGKSSVAEALSSLLPNYQLVEMDKEIENTEKMAINEIFSQKGEKYFRDLETQFLQEYSPQKNIILSLGGGAYIKEENRELLSHLHTVYLSASPETIYSRVKNDTSRPLLRTDDLKSKIIEILDSRKKFYECADFTIETDNKTIEEIANEILENIS